ncbi:hypothetical protein QTQ03_13790 [Micromonospora sp. WMMA1363]|uniref:hypothetical protein n=1 Tax=Micromonospora sp. WMMA1363 TaxID=3053985 RepID=UPI00259CA0D0|nr:hypothetical protein [Micromonospora sp. WMMA1363]MDM4720601.1 hypothetical protein [Micromonospora sp. WMMA1363]
MTAAPVTRRTGHDTPAGVAVDAAPRPTPSSTSGWWALLPAAVALCAGWFRLDTPVGVLAGLVFALFPTVSRYAQEARSYALVTLAAVAATWLFLRGVERPSRRRWWAYGIALVIIGWLHFVALLVAVGHVGYLRRAVPAEVARWRYAVTSGLAMLGVLPLLVLASGQSGQISWVDNDWVAVQRFTESLTGTYAILGIVVTFGVLGLALAGPVRRPAVLMLLAWAVLPPVIGYVTFAVLQLFLARYFLFTVPAWALLAAAGAAQLFRAVTRDRATAAALLGAVLLLPAIGYAGLPAHERVRSDEADYQPRYVEAVRHIAARARQDDGIAFNDGFGGSTDVARKSANYGFRAGHQQPRDVFLALSAADAGWLMARECVDATPCVGDTKRIWLIETGHPEDSLAGMPAGRGRFLRDRFEIRAVWRFDRVRVVLLERKGHG